VLAVLGVTGNLAGDDDLGGILTPVGAEGSAEYPGADEGAPLLILKPARHLPLGEQPLVFRGLLGTALGVRREDGGDHRHDGEELRRFADSDAGELHAVCTAGSLTSNSGQVQSQFLILSLSLAGGFESNLALGQQQGDRGCL
jgi:hypothetical protein